MRPLFLGTIGAFFLGLSFLTSQALGADQYIFEETDITPVVKYYATQVLTLKRPATVFNWGHLGTSPYWNNEIKQGESSLIKMAKNESHSFWDNYGGGNNTYAMFGNGLYAAVDPAITFTYGGGSDSDWLLFEMHLPAGFKFLDLKRSSSTYYFPDDVKDLLGKFDCATSPYASDYFAAGGRYVPEHCRKLIKEIFYQDLAVDGFAYGYATAHTKDCAPDGQDRFGEAFVILDDDWITPQNVKFYTKHSKLDLDHRIEIQTWILRAQEQADSIALFPDVIDRVSKYIADHPEKDYDGFKSQCDNEKCVISVYACGAGDCKTDEFETIKRLNEPLMTKAEAAQGIYTQKLLWNDLEGKPKAPDNSLWVKRNKYGCSEEPAFSEPQPITQAQSF